MCCYSVVGVMEQGSTHGTRAGRTTWPDEGVGSMFWGGGISSLLAAGSVSSSSEITIGGFWATWAIRGALDVAATVGNVARGCRCVTFTGNHRWIFLCRVLDTRHFPKQHTHSVSVCYSYVQNVYDDPPHPGERNDVLGAGLHPTNGK